MPPVVLELGGVTGVAVPPVVLEGGVTGVAGVVSVSVSSVSVSSVSVSVASRSPRGSVAVPTPRSEGVVSGSLVASAGGGHDHDQEQQHHGRRSRGDHATALVDGVRLAARAPGPARGSARRPLSGVETACGLVVQSSST